MIVLDANILLCAYDSTSEKHAAARAWVERALWEEPAVGIPWQTISAFLRVTTNTNLPGQRFSAAEALNIVDEWAAQPNVRILGPGEDHWPLLRQMITEGQARGPLVSDAQLAALTVEYGGVLCSTDRDFARFPGLRWKSPLEEKEQKSE